MRAEVKSKFKNLGEANAAVVEERKGLGGIKKRMTSLKATTKDSGDGGGDAGTGAIDSSPMPPNDEQLAKINQFTRSPKTADQVVAFSTLACNDLYDRDDERFTPETVQGFTELAGALSPVGKSYMVSHDYTKLPVGRLFDVGTKDLQVKNPTGETDTKTSKFMTAEVYMPNTESNKQFIENLDFGINWAVSVGVMLNEAKCSIPWCGAPVFMSRFFGAWCQEGHDKGYYYTQDAEKNSWGEYEPSPEGTDGAIKARVDLVGAKDFYELSQCFLGAQYFAGLDGAKAATSKGIIKAASALNIPIVGLSNKESHELFDDVLVDPRVRQAVRQFGAKPDDDGVIKWTDDQKLVWEYDPQESGVTCLGKSTEKEEADGESAQGKPDADALGEGSGQQGNDGSGSSADRGVGEDTGDGQLGSGQEQEDLGQDGDLTGSTNDNEDKEAAVSKAVLVKALKGLNLPDAFLRSVEDAEGDSLDAALSPLVGKVIEQHNTITELTPKAEMGTKYIESKRAEAIDWYVRANQIDEDKGVNTDTFTKLLDACGDNPDLIESLIDTHKATVQAKFPTSVRRSSFPTDPHAAAAAGGSQDSKSASEGDTVDGHSGSSSTISRIHG